MKTIFLSLALFLFIGCTSLQRIDQNQFDKYTGISLPKLVSTQLIGRTNRNVYIEESTKRLFFPGWDVKVYWIPTEELSGEQLKKVKNIEKLRYKHRKNL